MTTTIFLNSNGENEFSSMKLNDVFPPCLKIRGDFILITGDTISNMSLTQALQEHKERRKKDPHAIMTMVIKRSKPLPQLHQTRLGTDEILMGIDPETKELLYYEDKADRSRRLITLDKSLLADNPSLILHNDKEVLSCFNFYLTNYQE